MSWQTDKKTLPSVRVGARQFDFERFNTVLVSQQ